MCVGALTARLTFTATMTREEAQSILIKEKRFSSFELLQWFYWQASGSHPAVMLWKKRALNTVISKGGLSILWNQPKGARIGCMEHPQLHFQERRGFRALLLHQHQGVLHCLHGKRPNGDRAAPLGFLQTLPGADSTRFCRNTFVRTTYNYWQQSTSL